MGLDGIGRCLLYGLWKWYDPVQEVLVLQELRINKLLSSPSLALIRQTAHFSAQFPRKSLSFITDLSWRLFRKSQYLFFFLLFTQNPYTNQLKTQACPPCHPRDPSYFPKKPVFGRKPEIKSASMRSIIQYYID